MRKGGVRYDRDRASRGKRRGGRQLWKCLKCQRWVTEQPRRPWTSPEFRLARTLEGWRIVEPDAEGLPVTRDQTGRARVHLGQRHPLANRAGNQWLGRFLVMETLAEIYHQASRLDPGDQLSFPFGELVAAQDVLRYPLKPREHVHHVNGDKLDDDVGNYEVVGVEYHGSLHAFGMTTHRRDPATGRWAALDKPDAEVPVPRWGAIIGPTAAQLLASIGRPDGSR
jgi:hypothetical protein